MDQIDAIFDNCSSIEEIFEDLRYGAMVIVVDDESRENEGDLQMVAEKVTPEDINFMAQYARGLICLSLTQSRCKLLKLPLMVPDTDDDYAPNFTVSITTWTKHKRKFVLLVFLNGWLNGFRWANEPQSAACFALPVRYQNIETQ